MAKLGPRGFTLIEVLVALCLLSLAALGMVNLQWRSLHATHQSALHSAAMQLAGEIADALRAGTAPDASADRAVALLPGGRVVICRDPSPWDDAAGAYRWACDPVAGPLLVKVAWQEGGGAPAAPRLVVPVAPVQP